MVEVTDGMLQGQELFERYLEPLVDRQPPEPSLQSSFPWSMPPEQQVDHEYDAHRREHQMPPKEAKTISRTASTSIVSVICRECISRSREDDQQ